MSRYQVIHQGVVIGETELENSDEHMNVRSGVFVPSQEYSKVRHVFKLFADAQESGSSLDVYYRARDALRLQVRERTGVAISGVVHIADLFDELDQLEVELYPAPLS